MALMHFYAQMGMMRLGPYLLSMPDEMDETDRLLFTEQFKEMEKQPGTFEAVFAKKSDEEASQIIKDLAEAFMDRRCPPPQETVMHSFQADTWAQKDYYLPALKVLNYRDGFYWSPARTAKWKNMELKAEHLETEIGLGRQYVVSKLKDDGVHIHNMGECDCGIYGSVNEEELILYLQSEANSLVQLDPRYYINERRLCIIEPSNKAEVYLARKGWKATKAFISEVVGETISVADASELISMVWQRKIDVEKIYNKRTPKHEDW